MQNRDSGGRVVPCIPQRQKQLPRQPVFDGRWSSWHCGEAPLTSEGLEVQLEPESWD